MRDPALLFDLDGTLVDSIYQHVLGSAIRAYFLAMVITWRRVLVETATWARSSASDPAA